MPAPANAARWTTLEDGSRVRDPHAQAPADTSATPRTHADADALAAERGIVFPDDVKTVQQKVDFLDES